MKQMTESDVPETFPQIRGILDSVPYKSAQSLGKLSVSWRIIRTKALPQQANKHRCESKHTQNMVVTHSSDIKQIPVRNKNGPHDFSNHTESKDFTKQLKETIRW
jgi:hypothetical protein